MHVDINKAQGNSLLLDLHLCPGQGLNPRPLELPTLLAESDQQHLWTKSEGLYTIHEVYLYDGAYLQEVFSLKRNSNVTGTYTFKSISEKDPS